MSQNKSPDIITTLDSYTEYSPSGTGAHILCKGTIPAKDRRKNNMKCIRRAFFTVTGRVLGRAKEIQERTVRTAAVHAMFSQSRRTADRSDGGL